MTEAEWLKYPNPQKMLEYLGLRASDRKLRLFAAACCRRSWRQLTNEKLRLSIETAELVADGRASQKKRGWVFALAKWPGITVKTSPPCVAFAASLCSVKNIRGWIGTIWYQSIGGPMQQHSSSAALLRDIVGNPFHPLTIDPRWLARNDRVVEKLAAAVYEERQLPSGHFDPARLAILADALEEAGCTAADILDHLRGPGPHVRGCHVIDLMLGRE